MATEYYESVTSIVCAGQFTQVVQHWQIVDPANPNSFEVATAMVEAFEIATAGPNQIDNLAGILASDCFVSSFRARRLSPSPGAEAIKVFTPSAYPGALGGNTESAGVAGCVIWVPNTSDGATGRTFYPGVSESALEDGYWESSYVSAMNDLITSIIDDGIKSSEGDFTFVVRRGPTPGYTYHPLVTGYLSPSPGTIRRRRTPI